MAVIMDIVQGTTARRTFILKRGGAEIDLTGLTLTMQLRGHGESTYVDTAGDTTPDPDQVTNKGKVHWNADAADLDYTKSDYAVRFKVVDGSGLVDFWPDAEPEFIRVHRP